MAGRITNAYGDRVRRGEIEADEAQQASCVALDRLASKLDSWTPPSPGLFSFLKKGRAGAAPRGLYIHGAVGRGKTMLMDLFFEEVRFRPKRRLHFHEFMAEAHERIQRGRATTDGDPIPFVAAEIAAGAGLLCFDEFMITDIADAMIVGRLFKVLFERGTVVVATSNAAPERLYWNGLNRQLFLPFIEMLAAQMDVIELLAKKDFRLEKLSGRPLYFSPLGAVADAALDDLWGRLTGAHPAEAVEIDVKGRRLLVPRASMGVARFSFEELCARPLGANDYLHIAHHFHTVMVEGIPVLTPDRRNEARRFVHLIDALYDCGCGLIVSAAAEPQALYPEGDGAFLFERTASRLQEMRSEGYLAQKRKAG